MDVELLQLNSLLNNSPDEIDAHAQVRICLLSPEIWIDLAANAQQTLRLFVVERPECLSQCHFS